MERLTAKYGDKVVLPVIPMEIKNHADLERFHTVRKKYEENTIKLAEYEDIGLSTEEVKQFKDAEEQGLLLRLPCKVGDTVYTVCSWGIESGVVGSIEIISDRIYINNIHGEMIGESHNIFLSQEQAEHKLKEMNP